MRLKAVYTALLVWITVAAQAQHIPVSGLYTAEFESREGQQQLLNVKVPKGEGAKEFLPGWMKANILNNQNFNLQLLYTRQSPDGVYYTYGITHDSIAVYGMQVKLMVDHQSALRYAFHNIPAGKIQAGTHTISGAVMQGMAEQYAFSHNQSIVLATAKTWFYGRGHYLPAFVATIKDTAKYEVFDRVLDAQGQLLYSNTLHCNFTGPGDTVAHAYVYDPDPLTTAHVGYGAPYFQNGGKDNPSLMGERKHRSFVTRFNGREIILENSDFFFAELGAPVWPATSLKTRNTFNHSRSDHSFADVNVFYHLTTYKNYINSIGYTMLPGFKIQLDAHSFGGGDKSQFTSSDNPPSLQFGDGGVPDGEDADAVIHEYAHGLGHGASPNTNLGTQRRAIDEGLGDYFAVSYSKSIDSFNWQKVFNWDGNNGGWQGRTADYKVKYPNLTNNIWTDGQLWSTGFMRLYADVGRVTADKLMLEALFRLAPNISMPQLATAVMQIDSIKNGGVNALAINCAFASVGILQPLPGCGFTIGINEPETEKLFEVYNTQGFAAGEAAMLQFSQPGAYSLALTNALGQRLATYQTSGNDVFMLSGQNLPPGVYFLRVMSDKKPIGTVKLIKN